MRVIQNNAACPLLERTVWCPRCHSQLRITDKDIKQVEGINALLCPCCHSHFPAMTEAEVTQAYYNK